jgi:mannose-6-phosphate isomerase-like protein (cupin superfamily)
VVAWEQFVVLAGNGRARCDGVETALARGDVLIVPPGSEHVIENAGPGKLYCLTTMIPNEGFAELIRGGIAEDLGAADRSVLTDSLGVTP